MSVLTTHIAFDYKLIGVESSNSKNMIACVSIVNSYGTCIYDTYIKPHKSVEVTSYRTETTGITPSILKLGLDFHKVKEDVCSIIRGRVLVGHRVERGLKHFGLCHPKWNIRDLTEYDVFDQSAVFGRPSIRYLAKRFLGINYNIPEASVEKARLAMKLYTLHSEDWEEMLECEDDDSDDDGDDDDDDDDRDDDDDGDYDDNDEYYHNNYHYDSSSSSD